MKRKQRAAKVQPLPSPQPQQQRQSQPNPKQPEPIVIPSSPGAGITLASLSFNGNPIPDEGFAHGNGLSDDFKLWLSRHPGLTIEETLHRYSEEQKAKQHCRVLKLK